jgi:2,3-bisphosphoglycerate-independent phosphoglycerate mutase
MSTPRPRPVVLVVLDGVTPEGPDTRASRDATPVLSGLMQGYPRGMVAASGPDVGLPSGQATSAEVAHMAIGLGRPPLLEKTRVDAAIRDGTLAANSAIRAILGRAKDFGGRLHLVGLVSDGGIHSSTAHLLALIELAKKARVRVVVHALLDGRDVAPGTAPGFLADLEAALEGGVGRIGTVAGRSWGMGSRWDRIAKCYRAILAAEVRRADSALKGVEESYAAGKTDELVEPFVAFDYPGVSPVDVGIHFHLRADGARPLTRALAAPTFDGFARKGGRGPFTGRFGCLTTVDASLDLFTAFPRTLAANTLPEVVAHAGYKQLRCAEVEKAALVTSFFSAGREEPFEGEDRALVASASVGQATADAIRGGKYDFVVVSGTGALQGFDDGLGRIIEAARSVRGALVVTGSRGAHSGPAVPIIYVNDADDTARIRNDGTLCDVAPTVLDVLGLTRPDEMTGQSLLLR